MDVTQIMRSWLQGNFDRARQLYAYYGSSLFIGYGERFRIDMELELAHYRLCAELLKDAGDPHEPGYQMRRARLLYLTGDLAGADAIIAKTGFQYADRIGLHLSNTRALILLQRGEYVEAAAQFQQKLKTPRKPNAKTEEPETILALNGLALAQLGAHDLDSASDSAMRALHLSTSSWGESSIPALDSMLTLARIRTEQHDFDEARRLLETCSQGRRKIYETYNPKVAEILEVTSKLEMLGGEPTEAVHHAALALDVRQELAIGENPWPEQKLKSRDAPCTARGYWPARALLVQANAYAAAANYDMAEKCLDNAIPTLEAALGKVAPVVQQARMRRNSLPPAPVAINP